MKHIFPTREEIQADAKIAYRGDEEGRLAYQGGMEAMKSLLKHRPAFSCFSDNMELIRVEYTTPAFSEPQIGYCFIQKELLYRKAQDPTDAGEDEIIHDMISATVEAALGVEMTTHKMYTIESFVLQQKKDAIADYHNKVAEWYGDPEDARLIAEQYKEYMNSL